MADCPRCHRAAPALAPARVGDVTLGECTRCRGLFVDRSVFRRVLTEVELQREIVAASTEAQPRPSDASDDAEARCPECAAPMACRELGRGSGVIVDVCETHGVWFDHAELAAVVRFMLGGGLGDRRPRSPAEIRAEADQDLADVGPELDQLVWASPTPPDRQSRIGAPHVVDSERADLNSRRIAKLGKVFELVMDLMAQRKPDGT